MSDFKPPTTPVVWYQSNLFWAPFALFFTIFLSALGFVLGGKIVWAHICFALAWPFGVLALWAMCRGIARTHFRCVFTLWLIVLTIGLVWADLFATSKPSAQAVVDRPLDKAAAVYMKCSSDTYPIEIPSGLTINVLRISPTLLVENSSWLLGVFRQVFSPSQHRWPTEADGSWLSDAELKADPYTGWNLSKCEMSNLGNTTIEDVHVPLTISPLSKSRGRTYVIPFNPLEPGKPFSFYVINYCPTPVFANWPNNLKGHVVGEAAGVRTISLQMMKNNFPSALAPLSATAFHWKEAQDCNWKWQ